MNRNYEVDVDEDELDDELMEFERELAQEKKRTTNVVAGQKQNVPANTNKNTYKNQDIEAMLRDMWSFKVYWIYANESNYYLIGSFLVSSTQI